MCCGVVAIRGRDRWGDAFRWGRVGNKVLALASASVLSSSRCLPVAASATFVQTHVAIALGPSFVLGLPRSSTQVSLPAPRQCHVGARQRSAQVVVAEKRFSDGPGAAGGSAPSPPHVPWDVGFQDPSQGWESRTGPIHQALSVQEEKASRVSPGRRTCVATSPSSVEPVRQYALLLLLHVGMTRRAAEKTIGCLAPSRCGATAVDTPSRCGGVAFAAWTAASGRLYGTFHCRPWPSLAFGIPPCSSPCPPCRILSVLHSKRSSRWPPEPQRRYLCVAIAQTLGRRRCAACVVRRPNACSFAQESPPGPSVSPCFIFFFVTRGQSCRPVDEVATAPALIAPCSRFP
jgi:hypothetical protein